MTQPTQRLSPVIFPQTWELPARPEQGPPPAQDAFRQTEFLLKSDLRLLHQGMNLQLKVVAATYPSKYRTLPAAVFQIYWSRVFHYLSDAAALVTRGSYVGVPPLMRAACECVAAAVQLAGEELPEFEQFLALSLKPNTQFHATEYARGSYHAGGTLAGNEALGLVYRANTELARPHFGAALIESAPESNQQKLAVAFADQAFHYGWAQLELGWLLSLNAVMLQIVNETDGLFGTSSETAAAIGAFLEQATKVLNAPDRCRMEEVEADGERRILISNFRRQASGAPRKLLL